MSINRMYSGIDKIHQPLPGEAPRDYAQRLLKLKPSDEVPLRNPVRLSWTEAAHSFFVHNGVRIGEAAQLSDTGLKTQKRRRDAVIKIGSRDARWPSARR